MHKRLSLEMGGKNAMIVMDDADLDLALEGVLWGAFGTTGQRCTATSRLHPPPQGSRPVPRAGSPSAAEALRLGDGREDGTDVGPLIHEASREKVERLRGDRARGGRGAGRRRARAAAGRLGDGWFYQPTIFAGVRPRQPAGAGGDLRPGAERDPGRLVRRGGPVNNGVRYGLSSSLYTRDVDLAFRAMQELDNGITYVNAPTIGAEAHLPFGGVKQTGNGHREGGWEVYEFYSETKVCYVDYSGRLQRAQIDN